MAQPGTARITCSRCNASYDSESELREHKKMAHREDGSDQCSAPVIPVVARGNAPGVSSSVRLRPAGTVRRHSTSDGVVLGASASTA